MKIEKYRYDDILILKFTGEFDSDKLPSISEHFDKLISQNDKLVILDLHLLKFMDSAALGYLIKAATSVTQRGGETVLARPSKFVKRTLSVLGLENLFETFATVEDAIQNFKQHAHTGEHEEGHADPLPILFRPTDSEREPNQVGRITALYEDGLRFQYEPDAESVPDPIEGLLNSGQALRLKFRVPLAAMDRYLETRAHIVAVRMSRRTDDRGFVWAVRVRFDDLGPEDRELLKPFTFGGGTPGAGGVFARLKPRPPDGAGHAAPERDTGDGA